MGLFNSTLNNSTENYEHTSHENVLTTKIKYNENIPQWAIKEYNLKHTKIQISNIQNKEDENQFKQINN